ncbi:alpha-L-fucosidase [Clostridium sp.]|uniref:alpha-L-fucosidase n=1 Tax=Clostridium sp. TaxID=1506 RepID=UPI003F36BF5F
MFSKKIKKILAFSFSFVLISQLGLSSTFAEVRANSVEAPAAHGPVPSERQREYSKDEMAAFIHFGVNTFTDAEWGNGKENPAVFNPTELDPDQWARELSESGFKKVIITAKHHDGFNLFDSPGTDHDITNPAINEAVRGRDIVKELSIACEKYGLKFGVYLSPWDQNSPNYGDDRGEDYNEFFMSQLTKLLTEYGEISEVWFDGAKGSNVNQTYYFDQWFSLVKELQPGALIFSDMGPDVRWIGNESGYAGEPCWSKINGDELTLPHYNTEQLNKGDADGTHWIMGESDTSIRPGWFFHESQKTKSLTQLVDIYFNSVGRNSTLLLNVPPNKKGLLNGDDVARLEEFNSVLTNTFDEDLAINDDVKANTYRGEGVNSDKFTADKITDGDYDTYWTTDDGVKTGSFEIDLGEETTFDVISIQEYIPLGQRIDKFSVEVYNENLNTWKKVSEGQTIGYKRLVRIPVTTASKIRVNILSSQEVPLINNVSVYKADSRIEMESNVPDGLRVIDDQDVGTELNQFKYEGTWQDRKSETGFYGNTSHWTQTAGSKATFKFNGSKFFVLSATHPNHGRFSVKIDGKDAGIADLYGAGNMTSQQIIYTSEDLAYGEHTVELTALDSKSTHLDAVYVLENESGMVEINPNNITVDENAGKVDITVKRVGGSKGEVTASFILESGTAIQDQDFQRMIQDVTLEDGQTEATTSVVLFDNDERDGHKYFNVKMNKVVGAISGFKAKATINIMDDETPTNLAYNKKVTASSVEQNLVDRFKPEFAVDGDKENSRWSSGYNNNDWFQVDLGDVYDVNEVNIYWEPACGKQYKILTSIDGVNYQEVYNETNGAPGFKQITFDTTKARYVKMQGVERATTYGYSIYEFEVYGPKSGEVVDKSELEALISSATKLILETPSENITVEAKAKLEEAINKAQEVLNNDKATTEEVTLSINELNSAIDNFNNNIIIAVNKVKGLELSKVTSNSATLTWNAPNTTFGLVEYVVYKDGKELAKVPVGTINYTVEDLKANTIYGIKVTAKYSNGEESKPMSLNLRTSK